MLELTELQEHVEGLILGTPSPGKHSARSAIRHIQKAWEIRELDREMAGFRAITGEEESASAIYHALKRRRYNGADKLDPRNHVHKAALYPFLIAVSQALQPLAKSELEPRLELKEENGRKRIRSRVTVTTPSGDSMWAYPEPPLHYTLTINDKLHDFSEELAKLANEKSAKDMITAIRGAANLRNQIIYASQQGIPSLSESLDKYLLKRRDVIFRNLIIYLMIDPYREKQLFVQQSLAAFLKMLKLVQKQELILEW